MGEQLHKYKNFLNKSFHTDRPDQKYVADIPYIFTNEGILYLSMIRDLYDNSIVAYKAETQQIVNPVLDMIHFAMKKVNKKATAELQLHSGPKTLVPITNIYELIKEYVLAPSMLRCGNCYDNIMTESFFRILKSE